MYNYIDDASRKERAKKQKRILLIINAVLLVAVIILSLCLFISGPNGSAQAYEIRERLTYCLNGAKSSVAEIAPSVTSMTTAKVGDLKGYIFSIDQISLIYYGGKENRPSVLTDKIDEILEDIKEFDDVIRQSKSTLDVRSRINTHLSELEHIMSTL